MFASAFTLLAFCFSLLRFIFQLSSYQVIRVVNEVDRTLVIHGGGVRYIVMWNLTCVYVDGICVYVVQVTCVIYVVVGIDVDAYVDVIVDCIDGVVAVNCVDVAYVIDGVNVAYIVDVVNVIDVVDNCGGERC